MSKRIKAEYDLVIVGSGIAGLSFALKVAEAGYRVAIFTKKDKAESNTNYAQGGIAAVTSAGDDLDKHVEDTLEAGDGLCDPEIVREILRDGPARIQDLAEMGVSFSNLEDGRISLGKEGGHSKRRVFMLRMLLAKRSKTPCLPILPNRESLFSNIILPSTLLLQKKPASSESKSKGQATVC